MANSNSISTYVELGLTPCPVFPRSKRPVHGNWPQTDRSQVVEPFEMDPDYNIGIVLGDASGGIVDVDVDAPSACRLAPFTPPSTDLRFGRSGKPNSHFIYRCISPGKTQQFRHPLTKEMIIEFRANGAMTVFPGSIHKETGELIEFEGDPGVARETDREELLRHCSLVAIGSVVVERWAPGSRHKLALGACRSPGDERC